MFKIRFFNKKSISRSWFVSYLVIIAIATFINIYTYNVARDKVFEQINAINTESLERTRVQLDNLQKNIGDMASELSHNEKVHYLMEKNTVDADFLYKVMGVKESITSWENLEHDVKRVYIYFKNTDYIVDRSVAQKLEIYQKLRYKGKTITQQELRENLTNSPNGKYFRLYDEGERETRGNVIYTFSVFSEDLFTPEATIAVELENETLLEDRNENSYVGDRCILDEKNNLILSTFEDDEKMKNLLEEKITLTDEKGIHILDDEVILYTSSRKNNWKYVSVVEKGEYLSELSNIRLLTYLMIFLYIVVGIALAYYMTLKNRKPILQIVEQLSNYKKELRQKGDGNELSFINQCIVDLLRKREEQNSKIELQSTVVKEAVLNELLRNKSVPEVSLDELLSSVGVSLKEKYFCVVMFHIDYSGLFFEEAGESEDNNKLSQLIISNILGELLSDKKTSVFCNLNDEFICIINSDTSDMSGDIKKAIKETTEFVRSNFNLNFIAGMSMVHEGYYGLKSCYNEALECMEYKFFVKYDIIEYNTIKETSAGIYYFPIEKEVAMIGALKAGDYESSLDILNQVFDENLSQTKPRIEMVRCLVYDILGSVMKVINDLGETDGSNIFEHFRIFERIDSCKTVVAMRTEFIEIFKEICEKAISKSIEKTSHSIETIKEFIDTYYYDPNLSGAMVASHFGINQSYLSALFKKYTGEGLLEYTMKVRMEKALKMLSESNDTIEVISEKVGYINVKTFRRTFKKIYGFTPSMYREAVKDK